MDFNQSRHLEIKDLSDHENEIALFEELSDNKLSEVRGGVAVNVKFFNSEKGYGFIVREESGNDLFPSVTVSAG